MNKEDTVVSLVPKEELVFLKVGSGFAEHIKNLLSQRLADILIRILDTEKEVIVKQSEIMVNEYRPTNSVEYKRKIEWCPLVRCKDCKWYVDCERCCKLLSNNYEPPVYMEPGNFCSLGERREDNEK